MIKFKETLNKILASICALLFIFMTIVGSWQVISRYFLGKPSTYSEELISYSFAWMGLLAAAFVFGRMDHMRLSVLTDRLDKHKQIYLSIFSEIVIMIFAIVVLVYGGFSITKLGMGQASASLGISMGYIYAIIPVTGIITAIYNILNIYQLKQDLNNLK